MTRELTWLLMNTLEIEMGVVAAERIKEYLEYPIEMSKAELSVVDIPLSWPENGEIIFDNFKLQYRVGLDLVLKGISCKVRSGERVSVSLHRVK